MGRLPAVEEQASSPGGRKLSTRGCASIHDPPVAARGLRGRPAALFWALLLFGHSAVAGDPGEYPVRLVGALGGGLGTAPEGGESSRGAMGVGRLIVQSGRWAGEAAAREGWFFGDDRSVGAIFAGARWSPPGPAYARLGFAHHHEVPAAAFKADPTGAFIGSGEGIHHRSGLEAAAGLALPVDRTPILPDRLGLALDLGLDWLSDDQGPAFYGWLELGVTLDVGKAR
jgi:hypothetical protein